MSELPEGWSQQPLNNIASLKTGPFGSALKKSDYQSGATPVVNPMHINAGKIYPSHDMTVSQQTLERLAEFRLTAGDVVMGRRGEMGRCAVINEEQNGWLCGSGSFIVRPTAGVDSRYLQRFLSSPSVVTTLMQSSVGSTMVNLNQEIMRSLIVPLAPLAEQKRIADKLDALLARVDGCRARLARVPAILKRFRQAVLAAATSGALTADWREKNTEQEDWQTISLGEVASEVKNGFPFKPNEHPPGIPILRISSVRAFSINYQDIRYVPSEASVATYSLREGDLLFTRYNGSISFVGICAQVKKLPFESLVHPDKLIRVRLNQSYAIPGYIEVAANAPAARTLIEQSAKTSAGQTGISGSDLKSLIIPLPSLREQHEIVRRVETLFGYADRLEARYTAAAALVERLTPALLAKAFRGELVAQDPADEPAALLLARVQAARGAVGESPLRRRSVID